MNRVVTIFAGKNDVVPLLANTDFIRHYVSKTNHICAPGLTYRVLSPTLGKNKYVITAATIYFVISTAAVDNVVTIIAIQFIITTTAVENVVIIKAMQFVITIAAI